MSSYEGAAQVIKPAAVGDARKPRSSVAFSFGSPADDSGVTPHRSQRHPDPASAGHLRDARRRQRDARGRHRRWRPRAGRSRHHAGARPRGDRRRRRRVRLPAPGQAAATSCACAPPTPRCADIVVRAKARSSRSGASSPTRSSRCRSEGAPCSRWSTSTTCTSAASACSGRRSMGRPVVVLSNNDGACIARSNEAKDLGVEMAQPWFQVRHLQRQAGLIALSANFELYGDMSSRMMTLAAALCTAPGDLQHRRVLPRLRRRAGRPGRHRPRPARAGAAVDRPAHQRRLRPPPRRWPSWPTTWPRRPIASPAATRPQLAQVCDFGELSTARARRRDARHRRRRRLGHRPQDQRAAARRRHPHRARPGARRRGHAAPAVQRGAGEDGARVARHAVPGRRRCARAEPADHVLALLRRAGHRAWPSLIEVGERVRLARGREAAAASTAWPARCRCSSTTSPFRQQRPAAQPERHAAADAAHRRHAVARGGGHTHARGACSGRAINYVKAGVDAGGPAAAGAQRPTSSICSATTRCSPLPGATARV